MIIRQYIAEVEADYSRVKEVAEDAITEQLEDTTTRLGQINETNALIEEDKGTGLIKLLTQYKDGDKTSFADIIANAADATIKQSVGSAIGHDITGVDATLDGINGLLQNQVPSRKDMSVPGICSRRCGVSLPSANAPPEILFQYPHVLSVHASTYFIGLCARVRRYANANAPLFCARYS